MSERDPFDFLGDEADRTLIGRPPPAAGASREDLHLDRTVLGRETGEPPAAAGSTPFSAKVVDIEELHAVGANPLLAAAAPLIALVTLLRASPEPGDAAALRQNVVEELRRFQAGARSRGAADDEVRHGHYALCALIDEVLLSTPWGSKCGWAKQTLVATFHNEVVSGDRLLEIAEGLESRPGRSPNLLELIYVCLSFGFEGRLRLEANGAAKLVQLRERLHNAIQQVRGVADASLSETWRGADARYQPIARGLPQWVVWSSAAVLGVTVFALLLFNLSRLADDALKPLAGLYRPGVTALNRSAPAPASDTGLFTSAQDLLKPDVEAGRLDVIDQPGAVLVRLKDKGLFASGSADLDPQYGDTMGRIAQAIALTAGPVEVVGHTDDRRIRSLRFASNQELSEARAANVAGLIAAKGVPKERLRASGLGESEPVQDNASESGRAQNRRVEVMIPKTDTQEPPR